MHPSQSKGPYVVRQGVIELGGIWLEVSTIKLIKPPIKTFLTANGKQCYMYRVTLMTGEPIEVVHLNSIDSINSYEFAVQAWIGIKPSDTLNLNDLLGPEFVDGK